MLPLQSSSRRSTAVPLPERPPAWAELASFLSFAPLPKE